MVLLTLTAWTFQSNAKIFWCISITKKKIEKAGSIHYIKIQHSLLLYKYLEGDDEYNRLFSLKLLHNRLKFTVQIKLTVISTISPTENCAAGQAATVILKIMSPVVSHQLEQDWKHSITAVLISLYNSLYNSALIQKHTDAFTNAWYCTYFSTKNTGSNTHIKRLWTWNEFW